MAPEIRRFREERIVWSGRYFMEVLKLLTDFTLLTLEWDQNACGGDTVSLLPWFFSSMLKMYLVCFALTYFFVFDLYVQVIF